jgi:hypothetical protein
MHLLRDLTDGSGGVPLLWPFHLRGIHLSRHFQWPLLGAAVIAPAVTACRRRRATSPLRQKADGPPAPIGAITAMGKGGSAVGLIVFRAFARRVAFPRRPARVMSASRA